MRWSGGQAVTYPCSYRHKSERLEDDARFILGAPEALMLLAEREKDGGRQEVSPKSAPLRGLMIFLKFSLLSYLYYCN